MCLVPVQCCAVCYLQISCCQFSSTQFVDRLVSSYNIATCHCTNEIWLRMAYTPSKRCEYISVVFRHVSCSKTVQSYLCLLVCYRMSCCQRQAPSLHWPLFLPSSRCRRCPCPTARAWAVSMTTCLCLCQRWLTMALDIRWVITSPSPPPMVSA